MEKKDNIGNMSNVNKNMKKKINMFEEKLDKTIRCLDQVNTLENVIQKKDKEIDNLQKKIEVLESKMNILLENKNGKPKNKNPFYFQFVILKKKGGGKGKPFSH